jgi:hypothetical protein
MKCWQHLTSIPCYTCLLAMYPNYRLVSLATALAMGCAMLAADLFLDIYSNFLVQVGLSTAHSIVCKTFLADEHLGTPTTFSHGAAPESTIAIIAAVALGAASRAAGLAAGGRLLLGVPVQDGVQHRTAVWSPAPPPSRQHLPPLRLVRGPMYRAALLTYPAF